MSLVLGAVTTQAMDGLDRTVRPRQEVKAPPGAPNVVVILIDHLGFGATEVFGGPLKTPTMDRLGKGGKGTLYVDNAKVAEGRIEHTQGDMFSADETTDVGIDLAPWSRLSAPRPNRASPVSSQK